VSFVRVCLPPLYSIDTCLGAEGWVRAVLQAARRGDLLPLVSAHLRRKRTKEGDRRAEIKADEGLEGKRRAIYGPGAMTTVCGYIAQNSRLPYFVAAMWW
jgi:hypothetical protein